MRWNIVWYGVAVLCCMTGCGQTEVSLLTYNVAGLPEGISASSPSKNTEQIGDALNDFDVVLLQEDFAYHSTLNRQSDHPYRQPLVQEEPAPFNESGLARFSSLPLQSFQRWPWQACYGIARSGCDCLTPKGFSLAQHQASLGETTIVIDIYNLHMDAGDGPGDEAARQAQVHQLLETLAARSELHPVIVAGDTNVSDPWAPALIALQQVGFLDACMRLDCPMPESVDRVLYRSSPFVTLEPVRWRIPDGFESEDGEPPVGPSSCRCRLPYAHRD